MSLRFDHHIPATLRVKVHLFPGFDGFSSGVLHGLFGALSEDEEHFNHVVIRKEPSARFDGDEWTYTINENHITIEAAGGSTEGFVERVQSLLIDTRKHFVQKKSARGLRFMVPETVVLSTLVPEDKHKDVGTIVKAKALGRIKPEHYALLPGQVEGAAIRLLGTTDAYEWDVTVAPSLAHNDDLYVSAELRFPFPDDPPSADVELICGAIRTSADFLSDHAMAFAQGVLPENKRKKDGDQDG